MSEKRWTAFSTALLGFALRVANRHALCHVLRRDRARSQCGRRLLVPLAHNTSRIANRQTVGRDILGHHATRADNGVVADGKAGKDDHARADPHVVFNCNWRRWRHRVTPFDAMLVVVEDKRVMTQQAVAADFDQFVC